MVSNGCIDKIGIVEKVKENSILVRFQSELACGSCRAKFICGSGSDDRNLVEIYNKNCICNKGDAVKVIISVSMGFKALFLGYILPFLIVMCTLIITLSLDFSEPVSGLAALFTLIPYYTGLYIFKEKVNKKFIFTLMKIS